MQPDRLEAMELWTMDAMRSSIPLRNEAEAIAVALDTNLDVVLAQAIVDGARSVIIGQPADKTKRELVPTVVYWSSQSTS